MQVQTGETSMVTQRYLWEDPDREKCEGPESKDLTWKIMGGVWRAQCGSAASRLDAVVNKGNRIKVGGPD